MTRPEYPDRDRWPEYWGEIRRFAIPLAVGIPVALLLMGFGDALPTVPQPWPFLLLVAAAVVLGAVAERVARRLLGLWEARSA